MREASPNPNAPLGLELGRPADEPDHTPGGTSWDRRSQQLREQEWDMAQKLLATATTLLHRIRLKPGNQASIGDITRMLELASTLGRLATGLETGKTEVTSHLDMSVHLQFEAALKKIYGAPLPGEVVDITDVASPVLPGVEPVLAHPAN